MSGPPGTNVVPIRHATRLRGEIHAVRRRVLTGRVIPIVVGGAVLLIAGVRAIAPAPAGAVHSELSRLQAGNEIAGFVLLIVAFVGAYLLLAPDLHDEFESMSAGGASRPMTFAAARVLVGAATLLVTAVALGITVEALDAGGAYQGQEAVHVAVLFANALPVFMLALVLTCLFGRGAGLLGALLLLWVASDAAYQRGALADRFIGSSPLFSAEQLVAWFGPRSLLDGLPGIALIDQSVALQQFPVREGQAVWGADLIQVSGPADIVQYAVYLLALGAVLYVACRLRARRARSRFRLVPSWLEARREPRG